MIADILNIVGGIVSVYFVILTIYCGIICTLVIAPYIKSGGFYKEAAIARIGGVVYMVGGIGIYTLIKIFI